MEYDLESGPWDPIARVVSSCLGMAGNMTKNLGDVPIGIGGLRMKGSIKSWRSSSDRRSKATYRLQG